ncbi:conserved hypothetical protein [Histoplasma capsulatum var. duboisii H88]|uniref:Peptidase C45 hydrolase domain-containing protein n=2 Tax=Ajellomyces capsulatus TaxID=5037 RepID=F0UL36_AJEC8|nr:conserved hypothetical protein [Histoplasma capsulatum H143]EGC46140.1 conserved hypothetical protein [Histoplasma capsulatum var. duboisii H88]
MIGVRNKGLRPLFSFLALGSDDACSEDDGGRGVIMEIPRSEISMSANLPMDIVTDGGTRMQFVNEASLVGKIGMNSHGFGLCDNALRAGAKTPDRLPTHIMPRWLLQYTKSFEQALQMIQEYGSACTCNCILSDMINDGLFTRESS